MQQKTSAAPQVKTAWNIMLYLAGDNTLSNEMVWSLKEICRTEIPREIALTIQFDPSTKGVEARFTPLLQEPFDVDGALRFLQGQSLGEPDSSDINVIRAFIDRNLKSTRAKYHALILSGHGSGIEGDFLTDYVPGKKSFQKGSLSIQKFGHLLRVLPRRNGGPLLDVLGLDSCLMSMAEIASEIKGNARYLVGSEGFVQEAGWPYYRLFEHLGKVASLSDFDPASLAVSLAHRCTNYYTDYSAADISFDIAVCSLERSVIEEIESTVHNFVELSWTFDQRMWETIVLAHWYAQSYKWELYTDVWDFFDQLADRVNGRPDVVEVCKAIKGAVENAVLCSHFSGPDFQNSHGLSIYFPWLREFYVEGYKDTMFARETQWAEFLETYFERTQRGPRKLAEKSEDGWAMHKLPKIIQGHIPESDESGQAPASDEPAIAPGTRTTAPFSRTTAPFSRTTAPQTRFFDLVYERRSRMKNPPTDWEDSLMLREAEMKHIQKIERQYATAPRDPGTKRTAGAGR